MNTLKWFDKRFEETVMAAMLVVMTLIMGIQILSRYVLSSSLVWSEEITRYLFVWSGFLSISLCIRHGLSLRVDQVTLMAPKKIGKAIKIFACIVEFVFFGYMVPFAYRYVSFSLISGRLSPAAQIPMWVLQIAPLTGFLLATIRSVQRIILEFRAPAEDPHMEMPAEAAAALEEETEGNLV